MYCLTNEQRPQIIELINMRALLRKFIALFFPFSGHFNRPTEATIRAIVIKFPTKFILLDIKPPI